MTTEHPDLGLIRVYWPHELPQDQGSLPSNELLRPYGPTCYCTPAVLPNSRAFKAWRAWMVALLWNADLAYLVLISGWSPAL